MSSKTISLPRNLKGKEDKTVTVHAMMTWGRGEVQLHLFLTSALGDDDKLHVPSALPAGIETAVPLVSKRRSPIT
jgi:hypothetical protein